MDISASATCYNTLFNCSSCCSKGIFHTKLGFLHLCLGCCAYTDDRYATCELSQTLLKLFSVKIGSCLFYLGLNLCDSSLNCLLIAFTVNNDRCFLLNLNGFCTSELIKCCFLKVKSEFIRNNLSACKNSDILKHCFSSVTVSGCLNTYYLECSTKFVDNKSCKSLTLNILSNNEKLLAALNDLLKERKYVLNVADLLVCNQNIGIFKVCFHFVHICCHISADIASVKLHTFHKIKLCLHCL